MKEEILAIIKEISEEQKNRKVVPAIITDVKLHKEIKSRVLKYLRELYNEEIIDFGRTINNNFVEIRLPDSPKRNRKVILYESDLLKE